MVLVMERFCMQLLQVFIFNRSQTYMNKSFLGEQNCSLGEQKCSLGNQKCCLGEQKCSLGEQKCSLDQI